MLNIALDNICVFNMKILNNKFRFFFYKKNKLKKIEC
jgi:hypothetical protein